MLAWLGDLTARERRTMGACFGGGALGSFDVQIYSFVIPTVIALWGLSRGEAGLIGTVTLLISSLGGWFSGPWPTVSAGCACCRLRSSGIRFSLFCALLRRISNSCLF